MESLHEYYERRCKDIGDIHEHMPTLWRYAGVCNHVTEFGTRTGYSTTAFLAASPKHLHCYDQQRCPEVDEIAAHAKANDIDFVYHQQDTSALDKLIMPTDLLFIDTLHTDIQVRAELKHACMVRKYLIFHDTELNGIRPEMGHDKYGAKGIWFAIQEYIRSNPSWRLTAHYANNNGLTIFTRVE